MKTTINFGISEIRFYNTGAFKMPIATLKTLDEKKRTVGYLSPFRNYCFQVSGSFSGECDMGSTPVMGLLNVINAQPPKSHQACNLDWPETIQYMMKSLATMACIERATRQLYRDDDVDGFVDLKYVDRRADADHATLSDGRKAKSWFPTMMDIFVLETLRYLQYEHYKDLTEEAESK